MVYNSLYVIEAFGSVADRVRWELDGEPLIQRTIKLIESISKDATKIILSDKADQLRNVCEGVMIVNKEEGSVLLKNENMIKNFGALAFINPLRPFVQEKDLANALSKYFCQDKKTRQQLVSVSSVPNQYHPRKALNIDTDGWLKHYDVSGKKIYQRQQIENDPYYVINDALRIIGPENAFEDIQIHSSLSVVIEKAIFCVRTKDDLRLAAALMKNHSTMF